MKNLADEITILLVIFYLEEIGIRSGFLKPATCELARCRFRKYCLSCGTCYNFNILKMWTSLTNCDKQLTIHSKLREKNEDHVKLYEIVEVEFDQYKLKLLEKNDTAPEKEVEVKLSCHQLIQYGFEVEEKD